MDSNEFKVTDRLKILKSEATVLFQKYSKVKYMN